MRACDLYSPSGGTNGVGGRGFVPVGVVQGVWVMCGFKTKRCQLMAAECFSRLWRTTCQQNGISKEPWELGCSPSFFDIAVAGSN